MRVWFQRSLSRLRLELIIQMGQIEHKEVQFNKLIKFAKMEENNIY